MGGCSVLGCKNRFERGGKHFFRFPKEKRQFWIKFVKRDENWLPKDSSVICEVHFSESCFVAQKKRMYLSKNAIPTIYYEDTAEGIVKTEIQTTEDFELYSQQIEEVKVVASTSKIDKTFIEERLNEIKTKLCRFCAESGNATIDIKSFESFNIDIDKFFRILELSMEHSSHLSETICEECFNHVVLIDIFRTKCKAAEKKLLSELESLDYEIKVYSNVETLAVTEVSAVEENSENQFSVSGFDINDAVETEEYLDDIEMNEPEILEEVQEQVESQTEELEVEESIDVYNHELADGEIIKNPKRNKFILKVYECLFCKKKFGGKRTFKSHVCDVKEIECIECNKVFTKGQAYKSHVTNSHGKKEPEKNYCPMCKTIVIGSLSRFQHHRKKCNRERTEPIQCEICQKMLLSLNGYTIHKMFHESKKHNGESLLKAENPTGDTVCELCGKTFKTTSGYRTHKITIHNESNEVFACEKCGKVCNSKPALSDHKRNSHKVQQSPCNICGKIYRTKVLLRKHMIYHDQTKRVFKCAMCPEKPGYFTNVALKRHMQSHNGTRPYHCEECGVAYTSNQQLKNHIAIKHRTSKSAVELSIQQKEQTEVYQVQEEYQELANQQTQTILTIYPVK